MISFITWSNNPEQYKQFLASVERIECETICVGQEASSMGGAYNIGTKKAKGDILVYCHQDIRIRDTDFVDVLKETTKLPDAGFCGVAGSAHVSDARPWWEEPDESMRGWLIWVDRVLSFGSNFQPCRHMGMQGAYTPARTLDGLLLATTRVFEFPECLPGNHYLDQWMCREAELRGYTNYVMSTCVQHASKGGVLNAQFFINQRTYHDEFFSPSARRYVKVGSV